MYRSILKRSEFIVGVWKALRGALVDVRVIIWAVARKRQINAYLERDQPKKLHLGANNTFLPGWLNTDLFPINGDVVYLDATRRFPFNDNTFDYVMAEHMIEHLDYADAVMMLQECYRVLRPAGRIRIATPDLEVLIGLHSKEKTESQNHYIDWVANWLRLHPGISKDVFVINNAFRAWGHRFLYDRETLKLAMAQVGFGNLRFCKPGISRDPHLTGVESHAKVSTEDINEFETFVVEGECQKTRDAGM